MYIYITSCFLQLHLSCFLPRPAETDASKQPCQTNASKHPCLGSWQHLECVVTSYHNMHTLLSFWFVAIPTLSLGPDNNPTRPREEPLKKFVFVAFRLGLLAMCWNTYFYSGFTHHPNFAYKMGPQKTIMFHKMQNKNLCFRNCLLRKTKAFMFTKTQNLNNQKQR